jgi:hypothetical protein
VAPRDAARALALGRVAVGAALTLAPRLSGRVWIGASAAHGGATVLARGLGVRDAVIGAIALHTIDTPDVGPRWQATCALIDAVDGVATLAVRRELPRAAVAIGLGAVAIAAGEVVLARALRAQQASGG